AIVLWKVFGGATYGPELATLFSGHLLNGALTIALGAAAASLTEHPSSAAIVTLAITVGTWIISFIAAIHGGLWERIAAYTPAAIVADFQHGLFKLDSALIAVVLTCAGLGIAAIWQLIGKPIRTRIYQSAALVAFTAVAVYGCS